MVNQFSCSLVAAILSHRNKNYQNMKKSITSKLTLKSAIMALIAGIIFFTSCSSDDADEPVVFVIDEGDAAEFVAVVLSVNTYGFSANAIHVSEVVADNMTCGSQSQDSEIIKKTSLDGTVTYNYAFDESYTYSCDVPGGSVTYSFLAEQQLSTASSYVDSDISGIWTVSDIDNSEPSYMLSGIYKQNSDRDLTTDELPSAFITTDLYFTDLKIEKETGYLIGGTSQFELAWRQIDSDGQVFQGTINFSDPEATEVIFTDGGTYVLNMLTGEITKAQ
ncbi:hypothetical protein AWN68_11485 [Roseivirga echinicomitans]|uniref:Uncharacterized protein n=2 Tax=Roseivirga echinicomitans TaxID=296218 RepID=A0A150X0X8_9BACT|nr:hypothetical protein AWN68_11485 [Roseivirga echinicomitans]